VSQLSVDKGVTRLQRKTFIWLTLYNNLIISNLKLPNKFGVYEKRINGLPVKALLPINLSSLFKILIVVF